MRRFLMCCSFVLIFIWAVPANALQQRFELQDGTLILGEILSFDGSVFTIRTETLGTVKVEASKVRSIKAQGSDASGGAQVLEDLRARILANPEALDTITGLQNDPDMQDILQDSEILKAVEGGDVQKLMSNPKVLKLLQNPKIQEIGKGIQR